MVSTWSFALFLIRQDSSQYNNKGSENIENAITYYLWRPFLFTKHFVAIHRHVNYHNAYCLFTVWRGEHERQNAAVGLFCSLKAEEGHGNIYWEIAPPSRSHPARLAFELHSRGMCFAPHLFSLPLPLNPPFCKPSMDALQRDTHFLIKKPTAINVRWGQEELEEGEWRERGRCFPLDRLLRMHDESSQTHRPTCWERGGDERLQTFFPKDRQTDRHSRGRIKWLQRLFETRSLTCWWTDQKV